MNLGIHRKDTFKDHQAVPPYRPPHSRETKRKCADQWLLRTKPRKQPPIGAPSKLEQL